MGKNNTETIENIKYNSLPKITYLFEEDKEMLYNLLIEDKIPIIKITPEMYSRYKNRLVCFVENFDFVVTTNKTDYFVTIKKGFITDFATVPKIIGFFKRNDARVFNIASLIHDASFASQIFGSDYDSFKKANRLFRSILNYTSNKFIGWLFNLFVNNKYIYNTVYKNRNQIAEHNKDLVELHIMPRKIAQ